jgi:hypothetical protein
MDRRRTKLPETGDRIFTFSHFHNGPETHASEPIDWEIREARRFGKPGSRPFQLP